MKDKYEIIKIAKMSFEQYNSLFTNEVTDFSNYTHDDFDEWKQREEIKEWFDCYWDHSTDDILEVFNNVNNNYALIVDKNGVCRLHELPIALTKEHELIESEIEEELEKE